MSTHYTVIGGKGFIGSEIVSQLRGAGEEVVIPARGDEMLFKEDLGIVIYAAGNGDCGKEPFAVLESNTTLLAQLLEKAIFNKLIYISSTRLYMEQEGSSENNDLKICTNDNRRLFNLTKLVSEELCLRSGRETIVVRPSNVYGLALKSNLFLPSIIRNAITNGHIDMFVTPNYAKDYVAVSDVAKLVYLISKNNQHNVYNIASGTNTTAAEIADIIKEKTHCTVTWHEGYKGEYFPVTNISRTVNEFNYEYAHILTDIETMINNFKKILSNG
ncbi:NAD-dependent epimerase/dehydratase family protein [Vagococcus sp. WN89Y]|uniref:NAD-dependent epimerase/dehydratase family protein n=1 Tax=Vagococcus sp. WN89Y TaxID=3457258 RepID=UPI003FCED9B6